MHSLTKNSDERQNRIMDKLKRELGEDICALMNDPSVVEIMLNPDGTLWVEKIGQIMKPFGHMPAMQAEALMATVASTLNTTVTRDNPILECELPLHGARFEAWMPPVVSSPTFTIRCKATQIFTLDDYVKGNILSAQQKDAIDQAIVSRLNILVVGGTGTGKTTLTNAIIDRIVDLDPEHRLFIIEDTSEIQCRALNSVILRATSHVDMLQLLKSTMRGRPDRIIVGEVRAGAEALTLLKSWNTGHPGGVATIHANNAKAGLTRLEQLIAEVSHSPMCNLIAEAVGLIISISKDRTRPSGRKVDEMMYISGISDGMYVFNSTKEKINDKENNN